MRVFVVLDVLWDVMHNSPKTFQPGENHREPSILEEPFTPSLIIEIIPIHHSFFFLFVFL